MQIPRNNTLNVVKKNQLFKAKHGNSHITFFTVSYSWQDMWQGSKYSQKRQLIIRFAAMCDSMKIFLAKGDSVQIDFGARKAVIAQKRKTDFQSNPNVISIFFETSFHQY